MSQSSLPKKIGWFFFNIIQLLFTLSWSILWISVGLLVACTGQKNWVHWLARHVWAPGLLRGAGARVRVHGKLPEGGPFFIAVNHQSVIDIPVAMVGFGEPIYFIVKKELKKVPFLGWYIWAMDMIFVDRKQMKENVHKLQQAQKLLEKGKHILCFAEGTRSRTGKLKPFKSGAFAVAIEEGVPVLPTAIQGARHVLPSDGFRVRPGYIDLWIGEPIPTKDLTQKNRIDLAKSVQKAVAELLEQAK